jgi:uncharacterized protein (TIGR03435 family)
MLQVLLADRFTLRVHREARELPVYIFSDRAERAEIR